MENLRPDLRVRKVQHRGQSSEFGGFLTRSKQTNKNTNKHMNLWHHNPFANPFAGKRKVQVQVFHQCNPCNTKGTSGKTPCRAQQLIVVASWVQHWKHRWYVHNSPCGGGFQLRTTLGQNKSYEPPLPTVSVDSWRSFGSATKKSGLWRNDGEEYLIHKNWANCWKRSLRSHVRKDYSMSSRCACFFA